MTPAEIPAEGPLPDGVYIGLGEARYFEQDALGSSDLAYLWDDDQADGWWWRSRHNPWFVRKPSDPLDFGSALHAMLLEGREAFDGRYFIAPDRRDYPGLLVSQSDLFSALRESQAPKVPAKTRKADLVEMARAYLPDRHVWDDILERASRKARGRVVLEAEAAWQLGVMLEAAMAEPDMRAFATAEGGVRLTEVSVFWTLPKTRAGGGTRLRFRFDSLLPAANGDLKSIDNWRQGDRLTEAVAKAIGSRSLDLQAALSFTARRQAYRLIEAGRVFINPNPPEGSPDPLEAAAHLQRFPREAPLNLGGRPGWRWLWMFFQKPDQAGRAPTILPVWLEFGSLQHREGYRKAAHGVANYERRVAERGLDRPWTSVQPAHHLGDDISHHGAAGLDHHLTIPPWIKRADPVADEEAELSWQSN